MEVSKHFPDNMSIKITHIHPFQKDAISESEKLKEDGFMFMGEWLFLRWKVWVQIWYDDNIHAMWEKIEFIDNIGTKKSIKKALKSR